MPETLERPGQRTDDSRRSTTGGAQPVFSSGQSSYATDPQAPNPTWQTLKNITQGVLDTAYQFGAGGSIGGFGARNLVPYVDEGGTTRWRYVDLFGRPSSGVFMGRQLLPSELSGAEAKEVLAPAPTEGKLGRVHDILTGLGRVSGEALTGRGGMGKNPIEGRSGLRKSIKEYGSPEMAPEMARDPYFNQLMNRATSWFHGTGVDPSEISRGLKPSGGFGGPILGEPLGLSITPQASIAQSFGHDVYRLHPNLKPEEVLRLYTPEGAAQYRDIVGRAGNVLDEIRIQETPPAQRGTPSPLALPEWAQRYGPDMDPNKSYAYGQSLGEMVRLAATREQRMKMANEIRQIMRQNDYNALLYPPQRYSEYELRHLDPKRMTVVERRRFRELDDPRNYPDPEDLPHISAYPERFYEAQIKPWERAEPLFNPRAQIKGILEDVIRERYNLEPKTPNYVLQLQMPRTLTDRSQRIAHVIRQMRSVGPETIVAIPDSELAYLGVGNTQALQSRFPNLRRWSDVTAAEMGLPPSTDALKKLEIVLKKLQAKMGQ